MSGTEGRGLCVGAFVLVPCERTGGALLPLMVVLEVFLEEVASEVSFKVTPD